MANQPSDLQAMRHSLAHLLAAAVMELYPETKRTIGPAIDNGFYFDFDFKEPVSEADLPKIEKKMRQILPTWKAFERHELTADEAKKEYPGNEFKAELIDEFSDHGKHKVSFYKSGNYWDLCKGGHADDMSQVKPDAFKLTHLAGAYWHGDAKNKMLTRIYGVAFASKKALDDYLNMLEEAKKRDHRKLGQELDLFVISDLVGPGLPLFTPRGTVLRQELIRLSEDLQREHDYTQIWAPHIARIDLYKTSGHYDKYPERFAVSSVETDDQFMMKPMNCPHAAQIYASRPRSYRDLPLRLMETTTMYRDEKSGELHGLSRVRALTQDDSHAFCRPDQIDAEFEAIIDMVKRLYEILGMKLRVDLSFRDETDKYLGDPQVWEQAQATIERLAKEADLDYTVEPGEAAFYGPKIDIYISDALGREWQCATVQLDFVQPERFGLEYIGEDGAKHRPVMIHKALLGSIERFLSVYIEHTAGKFPVWVAPEQVRLITVNQEPETVAFAKNMKAEAKKLGLRVEIDNDNESVGKKIRNAELMKVPYTIVIGEKEIQTGELTPRIRKDIEVNEHHEAHTVDEFLKTVAHEAKARVSKTSL